MAKRKKTTTKTRARSRKKRKKRSSSLFSVIKQLFTWGFIVFGFLMGLLFLLDYLELTHTIKEKEGTRDPGVELPPPAQPDVSPDQTKTFTFPSKAEIPQLKNGRKEQVIYHEGYTVSYNSDYRIANWVAYELTEEEVKLKTTERTNKFVRDPQVKGATAMNEDYTRTGFDRGHLAPAGDMRWSAKAMRESFYLSNICPQASGLNRGIWKDLEEKVRLWAVDYGAALVITGPVIEEDMRRLGKNRVGVPSSFYKVIGVITDNEPAAIGFLFENREYKKTTLKSMAISVDSVEKVTGIDFFPSFPADIQSRMEKKVEWKYWSF